MSKTPFITQAIAIPYCIMSSDKPRFCMVTSNKKQDWIFPKGTVETGKTPEETALEEALEEAGLHGELEPGALGNFSRKKWGHEVKTYVYLMRVNQVDETWPESYKRRRRWRSPEKATRKLGKSYLTPYLEMAIERIEVLLNEPLQTASLER
jgi:8-oxo-dGTP pyrophosphatase MutT (NUDIX family)